MKSIPPLKGRCVLQKIGISNCRAYPYPVKEVQVLKEISGRITFGKNLGIVGPSGVGKTTLALIISGIIRPTKGEVKIGKCSLESLLGRELIYVPSQPYLFEGTIRENIALGKNIAEDEIAELLKTVELGELNPDLFIE